MQCRSCEADLPVDAVFCARCGTRVALGSVLGVGTDLPPVPLRDRPQAPSAVTREAGPTDEAELSQTRELPRLAPHEPAALPAPRDEGTGHSRNSILAMVATFAVLTLIGTFALTRLVGSDDAPASTQSSASSTTPTEEAGDASPAPTTTGPVPSPSASSPSASSPAESPTPEVSPTASTSVPAGARRCSTSGSDAVATAYAGTERTSCEFAAAVRDAYRRAGTPGGATSLRAYSPVTKKWYSLSCDGGDPVRCTSTTNAIVLLAP